jgi:addiction module RelB/DinJ family antitoxin
MSTAILTIKTDSETKRDLQIFAKDLGVTTTSVVNLLVKDALRTRRINISTELEPTDYLVDVMKQAEKDRKVGDYVSFDNKKDMFAYLDGLKKK